VASCSRGFVFHKINFSVEERLPVKGGFVGKRAYLYKEDFHVEERLSCRRQTSRRRETFPRGVRLFCKREAFLYTAEKARLVVVV
jgi:hypothetical protein